MSLESYWACRVCRSINAARSNRCYSCHTPREAAAVNPADLPTTGQAPPVEHTGTFRSSETFAVGMTLAAILFIFASLFAFFTIYSAGELRATTGRAAAEALLAERVAIMALAPIFGAAAILLYAAWISRVVWNLPAVKLGYSRVSAQMAFIEPLIPGFNLYALPARIGEALRKLDEHGPGLPLLGLSWILFVIPPVVAGVAIRLSGEVESAADFARTSGFALFLMSTFQAVGLSIGLYVAWLVERMMQARAEGATSVPAKESAASAG
jgi:hypothetical protein